MFIKMDTVQRIQVLESALIGLVNLLFVLLLKACCFVPLNTNNNKTIMVVTCVCILHTCNTQSTMSYLLIVCYVTNKVKYFYPWFVFSFYNHMQCFMLL